MRVRRKNSLENIYYSLPTAEGAMLGRVGAAPPLNRQMCIYIFVFLGWLLLLLLFFVIRYEHHFEVFVMSNNLSQFIVL